MTENIARHVRRVLSVQPSIEVKFTNAVRPDSYHQGGSILFLHPSHRSLVEELRRSA